MEFSHERYADVVKDTIKTIEDLARLKGGEYSGDSDRLANFRRNAAAAGTTMELVWRIYASKHWDAIMQYEKDLREGKTRTRLESLSGRVDDMIVYLLLFKCMLVEREGAKPEEKPSISQRISSTIISGETPMEAAERYNQYLKKYIASGGPAPVSPTEWGKLNFPAATDFTTVLQNYRHREATQL